MFFIFKAFILGASRCGWPCPAEGPIRDQFVWTHEWPQLMISNFSVKYRLNKKVTCKFMTQHQTSFSFPSTVFCPLLDEWISSLKHSIQFFAALFSRNSSRPSWLFHLSIFLLVYLLFSCHRRVSTHSPVLSISRRCIWLCVHFERFARLF